MSSPTQRFHTQKKTKSVLLPCTVSGVIKERNERPCLTYMDLTFPEMSKVNYLSFRNFYTESISIKHKDPNGDWVTVIPTYRLMKSCHCETDAQDWHTIDMFRSTVRTFDCFRVSRLRIYLTQASANWTSFVLHDVSVYGLSELPAEQVPVSVPASVLAATSQVLQLAHSIKLHREEYNRYEKFSKYLNKVPLEVEISKAACSEITELK